MLKNGLSRFFHRVALVNLFLTSSSIYADISVSVVKNYDKASENNWSKSFGYEIPADLIEEITLKDPSLAFKAPFKNVFFQNERVVVCHKSCSDRQLRPRLYKGRYKFSHLNPKDSQTLLKLATVYYWTNQLFDRLAWLGFTPEKRLTLIIDSEQEDLSKIICGAFYSSELWTINFPKMDPKLMRRLKNSRIRQSSALDPFVILHETVHFITNCLIKSPTLYRNEKNGIYEAVADYFAASLLDDPRNGLIMQKGDAARDLSQTLVYSPSMEAHDLGNVIGSTLWRSRALIKNPSLADQIVFDALKDLGKSPFIAKAGQFRTAYFKAFGYLAPDVSTLTFDREQSFQKLWDSSGIAIEPEIDLSMLQRPIDPARMIELDILASETLLGITFKEPIKMALVERRKSEDKDASWHYLIITEEHQSIPIWILYSAKSASILAVYNADLKPIYATFIGKKNDEIEQCFIDRELKPEDLSALIHLQRHFTHVASFLAHFAKEYRDYFYNGNQNGYLLAKDTPEKKFMKGRAYKRLEDMRKHRLNHVEYPLKVFKVELKYTPKAKIVTWVKSQSLKIDISTFQINELEFLTIDTEKLGIQGLVELVPGQTMVGYQIKRRDGTSHKILITKTGPDFQGRVFERP